jgi:GNAT superfamily N-acetyltransferase
LEQSQIIVRVATSADTKYASIITDEMASSAQARGTGIAKRSPEYIAKKMEEGKAVIALTPENDWVGFCYIEAWGHDEFVANSGLIVVPAYRKSGIAKQIKKRVFDLSREKYPGAKIFGLTTGLAVMKINSDLGYEPVTYSELTDDEEFWAGCKSCVNYDILMSKDRKNCMCTAMLYDPKDHYEPEETKEEFKKHSKLYERFMRIKQSSLIKFFTGDKNTDKNPMVIGRKKISFHNY